MLAAALSAGRRKEDAIARLRHAEFALLMPCVDVEGARIAIERMLALVRDRAKSKLSGVTLEVAAGYSTLHGSENPTLLARRAERALAVAKRSGGKRVVCLDEDVPVERSTARKVKPAPLADESHLGLHELEDTSSRAFTDVFDEDTDLAVEQAMGLVFTSDASEHPLFSRDSDEET